MRIAITTFYTESYEPLAAITIPILQKYTDKHGYALNIVRPQEGNIDFIKTGSALHLLTFYDAVFMIETDILIMNFKHKIEDFIDDIHDLFICKDRNNVNFGTAIVKNTNGGIELMNLIQSKQSEYKTEQNFLENYTDERICYLNHPSINSIPYDIYGASYGKIGYIEDEEVSKPTHEQGNYEPNDFLCHLPGKPLDFRIEYFKNHLKDIIYE